MASLLSIVAAFLVGLLLGWLIWGRILVSRRSAAAASTPAAAVAEPVEKPVTESVASPSAVGVTEFEPLARAEPAPSTDDDEPVGPAIAEPAATNESAPAAETAAADEPAVVADPAVDSEPAHNAEPVTLAEPFAEPEPEPEPEPFAAHEPVADPEPVAEPVLEPVAATPAAPAAEPEPELEPVAAASAAPVAGPAGNGAGPVDKLTRIEGIGPKIAATLAAAGIRTYRDLADTDLDALRATIKAAKLRLSPNLATWPEQARLLADGDQRGFTALAEDLAADREPGVEPITTSPVTADLADPTPAAADPAHLTPAAADPADLTPATTDLAADQSPTTTLIPATAAEPAGLGSDPVVDSATGPAVEMVGAETAVPAQRLPEDAGTVTPDDLTRIEGIGPKMAAALITAGITTYAQLAASEEASLRAAIAAAGMRFSPSLVTWPQQAKLLADRVGVAG